MGRIGLSMYANDGGALIEEHLTERLSQMGHTVTGSLDMRESYLKDGQVFSDDGRTLSDLDVFFHMDADRQSVNQFDQLWALERSGVQVINTPQSYANARDKAVANQLLRNAGFVVPRAVLLTPRELKKHARALHKDWGSIVVKPRTRHGGYGIIKFDDASMLSDFVDLFDTDTNLYCEEFIPFGDTDFRVEVADAQGIGGYSRKRTHAFKTNVSSGGLMTANPPDAGLLKLSEAAVRELGLSYSIIDFLKDERTGNITIIEVNPLLGIFVEEAMRVSPKTAVREIDKSYALDDLKIDIIAAHLDRLANDSSSQQAVA